MKPAVLYADTLRALLAPRRAVPLLVLTGTLLAAQGWYGPNLRSLAHGSVAVASFLLTGPFLWRAWRPAGDDRRGSVLAGLVLGLVSLTPLALLWWQDPGGFLVSGLNSGVVAALFWVGSWGLARDIDLEADARQQRARAEELRRQAEQAELLALKAHLDPHFLFNSLNAIAAWCQEDPVQAEAALLRLAALLREVMAGVKAGAWPLARELALVRDVAAIWAVRDPERFQLDWAVEHAPELAVPPMVLLPVIENAYTHGPGAGHRGRVRVTVVTRSGFVGVEVSNPGSYRGPRPGGEGLRLVERRAALAGGSFMIAEVDGRVVATVGFAAPRSPGGSRDGPASRDTLSR